MEKRILLFLFILTLILPACHHISGNEGNSAKIRPLVDTVGFAQYTWQMDSLMARMENSGWKEKSGRSPWRLAICPHDDYTYTGSIYPELLQNIKARLLILIGVAHKAAQLRIEDSLVFDSYSSWKGPWKNVAVSPARKEIFNILKGRYAIISDTLQRVEHSLEAMIPFLQYFNRNVTIIPVIVPAMSPERMKECGKELAEAIKTVALRHRWKWGKDFAIVATTDAVHYGNEDWGGSDRARFGCDSAGNTKALEVENEIINNCLTDEVTPDMIRLFSTYTLNSDNYKEYKWTWCGRYSVPVALYTAYYLNDSQPLSGELADYSTSITRLHVPVTDIGMGRTAIATPCHWVGYAAVGYR
jgi:AmmeMemoRadiSam system protein B